MTDPREDNKSKIPRKLRENSKTEFGPSLTKQSELASTDVNNIMKRYRDTGALPTMNQRQPFYGDVSAVADYQSGLNIIQKASDAFSALGSRVRKRFGNDPYQMVEFLADPKNRDEAIKLGLINPPKAEPSPVKVEVTNVPPVPAAKV